MKKISKQYMVSLVVEPNRGTVDDVSKMLHVKASNNSCNKGDVIFGERKAKRTIWIYEVKSKNEFNLNELIGKIVTVLKKSSLKARVFPRTWKAYLNVGVMYNTYTCSLRIPARYLEWLTSRGVDLRISCYPTDFKK